MVLILLFFLVRFLVVLETLLDRVTANDEVLRRLTSLWTLSHPGCSELFLHIFRCVSVSVGWTVECVNWAIVAVRFIAVALVFFVEVVVDAWASCFGSA